MRRLTPLDEIYAARSHVEDAMPHFYRAYAIVPLDHVANPGIVLYQQKHNQISQALEHFKIVVKPGTEAGRNKKMQAYEYTAQDYDALGDHAQAEHYRDRFQALSKQPNQ